MRVVVTGATGNVGSAVVRALVAEPEVDEVVGVSRRRPDHEIPGVTWHPADVATDNMAEVVGGADAVVHLAWLLQPSHRPQALEAVNVNGTRRVFTAAAQTGVRTVVYASSVGAYSPGPKTGTVDESWPTDGVVTSSYGRQKSALERWLDEFEPAHPDLRIVRMRPGLIMQRQAAAEIARLFLGPFVPLGLLRPDRLPLVPRLAGLRLQVVHADDVADAFRRALLSDVRGAINVATEPVVDTDLLAGLLHARAIPLPTAPLRWAADLTWRLHLQPTEPGWLDLGLNIPVMSTDRARSELGWTPRHTAQEVVLEILDGLAGRSSGPTPPLVGGHRVGASVDERPGRDGVHR